MTRPKIGQIWESQDPRDGHRRLKVIGYEHPPSYVICRNVATGRTTKISYWRLRPLAKRGYVLVEEESYRI